jgi:hypothetical protein
VRATKLDPRSEVAAIFIRHRGTYRLTYFHRELNCEVSSDWCSVQAFLDAAGLDDSHRQKVVDALQYQGRYEVQDDAGHPVVIERPKP